MGRVEYEVWEMYVQLKGEIVKDSSSLFLTLSFSDESLLGLPCRGVECKGEKQVRINVKKTREYIEGFTQVISKSSPLQGMKAQPLQPLFVCQLPTLWLIFGFALNGWNLPRIG